MEKHAYCIMAHHNWWQLKVLLRLLDDDRNDVFIHIDRNVRLPNKESIVNVCKRSNVKIYRDIACSWGGYSLVKSELILFQRAIENNSKIMDGNYAFFHLLSGTDLPIKSQDYIHNFFNQYFNYNFVRFDDDYAKLDKIINRARYFYLAYDITHVYIKRVMLRFDYLFRIFQRLVGVNRLKNYSERIYYGSQWVSLKAEAVEYLLLHKKQIYKMFCYTNCPDELYKQTLLRNANFPFFSMDKDFVKSCMRYIDFSAHLPNPKTITVDDYDKVMNSGALFARTFDENVDREVILKVYKEVTGEDYKDD